MNLWSLKQNGYDPKETIKNGNRFLIANGYMGVRGTVEEAEPVDLPAINLAGVYDQNGDKWREPVNAPYVFIKLILNGRELSLKAAEPLSHSLSICYRHGVFERKTDFGAAKIGTKRIASLADPHLIASQVSVSFAEDGEAVLIMGLCTDIWDINGPHLFDFHCKEGEPLLCEAVTGEKQIPVCVAQAVKYDFDAVETFRTNGKGIFRVLRFHTEKGDVRTGSLFTAVYTGQDDPSPSRSAELLCERAKRQGWGSCFHKNAEAWENIWKTCETDLEGDEKAALSLHASQYYLNSIAPRHRGNLSIAARGLSGQTYKGAVFWDTEIFLFPMFVRTQPEIARSLLRYRIETLPGARKKAAEYGYRGAFYAWESQEGGREGCTDFNVVDVFTHRPVRTYFRDKQIHISADIVYAMQQYCNITGDRSLLLDGGAEVILECARFYLSRMSRQFDRDTVDLVDVIGPDEYHERVTNNAFTNRMVKFCLTSALNLREQFADEPVFLKSLIQKLDYEKDWELIRDAVKNLRGPKERDGVTEQFDGYFSLEDCTLEEVRSRLCDPREYWGGDHGVAGPTQIIKQADVIALMELFPEDFTDEQVAASWNYYESRTEHGSSLSACMYALTACRIGKMEKAWELFQKTAEIDLISGGKQWAGEIYIGGTHPASNGGAWMIAVLGFAGLQIKNEELTLSPRLPKQIRNIRFRIRYRGSLYLFTVTQEGWKKETIG